MRKKEIYRNGLKGYIPDNSVDEVVDLLCVYPVKLKIKRSRRTKSGDFRPPQKGESYHRITVNCDLDQYSFLIVLIHEIAHMFIWEKYECKKYVKPHGKEWKKMFSYLLSPFCNEKCFPYPDLLKYVRSHASDPKASLLSDRPLLKELNKRKEKNDKVYLEDISDGSYFILHNDKVLKKLSKRRTRYKCKDQNNGRVYLVHSLAEVIPKFK